MADDPGVSWYSGKMACTTRSFRVSWDWVWLAGCVWRSVCASLALRLFVFLFFLLFVCFLGSYSFFSVLFCLSVCQCLLLYLIVICLFVCLFVCQSPSVSVISNDIFYFFITALNVGNLSLISIFGSLDYM